MFNDKNKDIKFIINLKQENAYILITTLLILLVLTVIGFAALGTSRIENMLSGNIRLRETALSAADSAVDISASLIEHAVRTQNTTGYANIVNDSKLALELRNTPFDSTDDVNTNPDVKYQLDNQNVSVDIDKMYVKRIGGTAIEYASGYEGAGKSGASSFYAFYRINSKASGQIASEATVGTIYRYVPR